MIPCVCGHPSIEHYFPPAAPCQLCDCNEFRDRGSSRPSKEELAAILRRKDETSTEPWRHFEGGPKKLPPGRLAEIQAWWNGHGGKGIYADELMGHILAVEQERDEALVHCAELHVVEEGARGEPAGNNPPAEAPRAPSSIDDRLSARELAETKQERDEARELVRQVLAAINGGLCVTAEKMAREVVACWDRGIDLKRNAARRFGP